MPNEVVSTPPTRLPIWFILTVCSAVALIALVDDVEAFVLTSREIGNIAFASISLFVGVLAIFIHVSPFCKISKRIFAEFILILICLVIWSSALAIYFRPRDTFVQIDESGKMLMALKNANIYYFSWGAFLASCLLLSSYIQSVLNIDMADAAETTFTRFTMWFMLFIFGTIVTGSASDIFTDMKCSSSLLCRNTVISIGVGVCTAFFSLVIVFFKIFRCSESVFHNLENIFSLIISGIFLACMIFITGSNGPGVSIGNLYYFAWLSFLASLGISFQTLVDLAPSNAFVVTREDIQEKSNGGGEDTLMKVYEVNKEDSTNKDMNLNVDTFPADEESPVVEAKNDVAANNFNDIKERSIVGGENLLMKDYEVSEEVSTSKDMDANEVSAADCPIDDTSDIVNITRTDDKSSYVDATENDVAKNDIHTPVDVATVKNTAEKIDSLIEKKDDLIKQRVDDYALDDCMF